ncbi:gp302 [Sphingomonas phage PAU]|uniref:gp302 n=1 Tax=Sphingomonas phage PAU TaxID=1150991 RepID=UPI00025734AD|nr:gp302 [Sphingomonas phage PAU]AFF28299.1 gp302 [Sphingomonas phage PAU]
MSTVYIIQYSTNRYNLHKISPVDFDGFGFLRACNIDIPSLMKAGFKSIRSLIKESSENGKSLVSLKLNRSIPKSVVKSLEEKSNSFSVPYCEICIEHEIDGEIFKAYFKITKSRLK